GHMRLGESMSEAVRELEEELGLADTLDELLPFGTHRQEHVHASGLIDREHHALHLLARPVNDVEFRPDPEEVQGLAWVPGNVLIGLAEGDLREADVDYLAVTDHGRVESRQRLLRAAEIVPYDGLYHRRVVDIATATLRERGFMNA
ncbi:MAG: NUDIX domain-containing protein, partial [Chloroflexota bacterium]